MRLGRLGIPASVYPLSMDGLPRNNTGRFVGEASLARTSAGSVCSNEPKVQPHSQRSASFRRSHLLSPSANPKIATRFTTKGETTSLEPVMYSSVPNFVGLFPPLQLSLGQPHPYLALDANPSRALPDPHDRAQVTLQHASSPASLDPCRRPLSAKTLLEIVIPTMVLHQSGAGSSMARSWNAVRLIRFCTVSFTKDKRGRRHGLCP